MSKFIYWVKYDTPIPYKDEISGKDCFKNGEFACLNKNVEKVWQTGSISLNDITRPHLNIHLLMKDGIRKDFFNFNLNEDYSPIQNWLKENNY